MQEEEEEEEGRAQRSSSAWIQRGGHSANGHARVMAAMARARTGSGGLGQRAQLLLSQVEVPVSVGSPHRTGGEYWLIWL